MAQQQLGHDLIDRRILRAVIEGKIPELRDQWGSGDGECFPVEMKILRQRRGFHPGGEWGAGRPMVIRLEAESRAIQPRPFPGNRRLEGDGVARVLADFFERRDRRTRERDAHPRRFEILVRRTRRDRRRSLSYTNKHLPQRIVGKRARSVRLPPEPRLPARDCQRRDHENRDARRPGMSLEKGQQRLQAAATPRQPRRGGPGHAAK